MKQFRSRFVLYAFLFVLSAFVLCGAAEAGDPVTLKFLHKWPKVEYNDFFLQVARDFEKAHPDVKIQIEAAGDEPIKDKLRIQMGTDQQPDIFFSWSGEFARNFIRSGAVLDLTPYFEKEPSWRDGFMKAGLEPFATQGRYYGVQIGRAHV